MEHRHDDFDAGLVLARVHADGDAVTVVLDLDAAILENGDIDARASTCHRLVDAVVDDLLDELVETTLPGVADVHGGAALHPFQAFENLNGVSRVLAAATAVCRAVF